MGDIENSNHLFGGWQEDLRDYQGMVVESREAFSAGHNLVEEIMGTYTHLQELLEKYAALMEDHRTAMRDGKRILAQVCNAVHSSGISDTPPYSHFIRHLLATSHYHDKVGAKTNHQEAEIVKQAADELRGPIGALGQQSDRVEDNSLNALREAEGAIMEADKIKGVM